MNKIDKAITKMLERIGYAIEAKAVENAPVKEGRLRSDIKSEMLSDTEVVIGNSRLIPYAKYVHEGTGLYGKHKRRIKPKKAKALKTPLGYFKSVAGQKAQPYLEEAAKSVLTGANLNKMADSLAEDIGDEIVKDIKDNFVINVG